MKRKNLQQLLYFGVVTVLIAAMALCFAACNGNEVFEGEKTFTFIWTDLSGKSQSREITTDAKTVGEALIEGGFIEGEEGQYGMYVKKVCGITADHNTDKTYWAFYIGGEYAMTGVEKTDIVDGETYEFKIEK